ncbi:MAG TPA: hypothetical protein VD970_08865 [Acetobacteraceae bacterium]|nr:hypothetical protein [Acetobacteraceae bacterium]
MIAALAEAWLILFLLATGLLLGAVIALAMGRLLAESWLDAAEGPLAAAARALPVLLLLGLPLLLLAPWLYPWAAAEIPEGARRQWYRPELVALRSAAALLLWAALGRLLTRAGAGRRSGGTALLLLVPTAALALEDWVLSRDPAWTGSLQGLALAVEQAAAALSLATLIVLRAGRLRDAAQRTGLERALLSLALAVLWLWFMQFVVAYSADLPAEAGWYARRAEGGWAVAKAFVAVPALLGAIALAIVPQWRDWRFRAVAALLILAHLAHLAWVVRPDAALAPGAGSGGPSPLLDAVILGGAALAALLALRRATREHPGTGSP